MITWLGDKLWIRHLIQKRLGIAADRILFSEHHLSHAASAFFCSPFYEAAILTVDGVGEWTTASLGVGRGTDITLLKEIRFPHSLGRDNQHYADIAASIQKVTEEVLLTMARAAYAETGLTRLCMAGGVALNSVANGRIIRETAFEELYVHPAAGDGGAAVGAALYGYHAILGKARGFVMEHAASGEAHR